MKTISQLNALDKQKYLSLHILTLDLHIQSLNKRLNHICELKNKTTYRLNSNFTKIEELKTSIPKNDRILADHNMERLVCLDILYKAEQTIKTINSSILIATHSIDEFESQIYTITNAGVDDVYSIMEQNE